MADQISTKQQQRAINGLKIPRTWKPLCSVAVEMNSILTITKQAARKFINRFGFAVKKQKKENAVAVAGALHYGSCSGQMSLPIEQQSPPAPGMQQPYGGHPGSGSVGPVIGVLVVIIVFAVVAVVVGRLCSGRSIMGYGHFDLESWAESKCSSCIDGRISPPPPRVNISAGAASVPAATMAVQTQQETKQEEPASQNPPANA